MALLRAALNQLHGEIKRLSSMLVESGAPHEATVEMNLQGVNEGDVWLAEAEMVADLAEALDAPPGRWVDPANNAIQL